MPVFLDGEIVFVHIPKCAGTSIRNALVDHQVSIQPETLGYRRQYRNHESLFEIQNWFTDAWGVEKWEQANVISTFRHPIDRAISWWKYRKKMILANFPKWKEFLEEGAIAQFDAANTLHPYVTPEEWTMYHGKHPPCHHVTDQAHVEAFGALSFHDFTAQMTIWKVSGCSYPDCPYHALAPQICWLHDVDGNIQMDRLNLFLVERLDELEGLLPEMPKLECRNVTKKEEEDYRNYLTTTSLIKLNKFYAEDFKLYKTLKDMPPSQREPLRFKKQ